MSDAEKNIIRAALKLMDEKEAKMQQNTVYGVSALQSPRRAQSEKVHDEEQKHLSESVN